MTTLDPQRLRRLAESQRDVRFDRAILAGNVPLNPEMIRLARECRGLARWELARLLRVPTADVAAWEAGKVDAKAHAAALSDAIGFLPTFFVQTDKIVSVRICTCDDCSDLEPAPRPRLTHTPEQAAEAAARVTVEWDKLEARR